VIWLQRDFGIYIVNMFDTGRAMQLLSFPKLSLQYLVQHYCNGIVLDKQYQRVDWRIRFVENTYVDTGFRPLPDDYINSARSDTHYLLYCYDRLRNQLIDNNLIIQAYDNSRSICQRVSDTCISISSISVTLFITFRP
jgi:exosome complex exonuclease RRP6